MLFCSICRLLWKVIVSPNDCIMACDLDEGGSSDVHVCDDCVCEVEILGFPPSAQLIFPGFLYEQVSQWGFGLVHTLKASCEPGFSLSSELRKKAQPLQFAVSGTEAENGS